MFDKLQGKNVLIFDTETTGLPEQKARFTRNPKDEYYDLTDKDHLKYYKNSRIVEIAWCYIEDFSVDKLKDVHVKSEIRKPTDFKIANIPKSAEAIAMHKIDDKVASGGKLMSKILNSELADEILEADYIVGHNVHFDIFLLMSECIRLGFDDVVNKLRNLVNEDKVICTMTVGAPICSIPMYSHGRKKGCKPPRLEELYEHFYGSKPVSAHRAKSDVETTKDVLLKLIENNKNKLTIEINRCKLEIEIEENSEGEPLDDTDVKELLDYLNSISSDESTDDEDFDEPVKRHAKRRRL